MKGIFKWSLMGGCFLFSAMQVMAQFSVTLPYKQVTVENMNGKAAFSGAMINGDVGKPAMPRYLVSFLLPPDVDFKDVTVSLINPVDQELAGTWYVNPITPMRDKNDKPIWPKGIRVTDGVDTAVYGKNASYPGVYQGNVAFGKMRQYKIVDITVNPYQWNPVTGKLRTITPGTLVVTVPNSALSTGVSVRNIPRCGWAEKILASKVVNFSEVQYYGATPAQSSPSQPKPAQMSMAATASVTSANYVIITTNAISNHSQMLSSFITLLQNEYYSVYVATESTYGTGATAAACAANIRTWLYNNYISYGIQYVLLIGNPNPLNTAMPDVPMMMEPGDNPTDFYYAELSNPSDISDANAEVSVGRIPVFPDASGNPNITNLDKILLKTKNYKESTNTEWRRFAMLPVMPVGETDDFNFGETIVNNSLIPAGWGYRRLYEPYDKSAFGFVQDLVKNMNPLPEVPFCNKARVANNWNTFNPGLVVLLSHGHSEDADSILDATSVQNLNDNYPAVVFAASCSNLDPTDLNPIGYSTVLYNAVAYIGGTGELWTDPAKSEAPIYAGYMVNNLNVGDALRDLQASSDITSFPPTAGENGLRLNLYGCPEVSLGLWTSYNYPMPAEFNRAGGIEQSNKSLMV